MVLKFTKDVDSDAPTEMPKPADFEHGLHTGENCFYFFIKRGDRIYPVMPRRFLSVLFDTWGNELKRLPPLSKKQSNITSFGYQPNSSASYASDQTDI